MNSSGTAAPLLSSQLCLPFVHDLTSLRDRLRYLSGKTVVLTITDNAVSMLSVRKRDGEVHVRLHRMFLHAGEDVLEAVAGFLKGEKGRRSAISDYIRQKSSGLARRTTTCTLRPGGAAHCLTEIFDRVNRAFFQERVSAGITWGKYRRGRRARRITLGSYCRATNIIRVNPLLDRKSVPRYFLEFIVYHEMLHADLGFIAQNGRRKLHTKEFRVRERRFPEYEKAITWEKLNLG